MFYIYIYTAINIALTLWICKIGCDTIIDCVNICYFDFDATCVFRNETTHYVTRQVIMYHRLYVNVYFATLISE